MLDRPLHLEIAKQHDRVGEIGQVDRRLHVPHDPLLGQDHDRDDTLLVEEGEELVQLQSQVMLLGHGIQVSVDAVDDDHASSVLAHGMVNLMSHLARRNLGGIDLLDEDRSILDVTPQVHP